MDRKRIEIAARLYQCHGVMTRLYKEEFPQMAKKYKDMILKCQEQKNVDTLHAMIDCMQYMENGFQQVMLMAAAVDMIENDAVKN
jgi:hypothetical protein